MTSNTARIADDDERPQLSLKLGPAGLAKERAVIQAFEILIDRDQLGPGEQVTGTFTARVAKAGLTFDAKAGDELRWVLVAIEAELDK